MRSANRSALVLLALSLSACDGAAPVDAGAPPEDSGAVIDDAGERCGRWSYEIALYEEPCRTCWVDECGAIIGDERVRAMSFCAFCPFGFPGGDWNTSCECAAAPLCEDLGAGYIDFHECVAASCVDACGLSSL